MTVCVARPTSPPAPSFPRLLPLLLLALAGVAGCADDFPGDPPDPTRFEHPVGVAVHPNGRYAYVVSANFDLRYRIQDGGLLSVIDLQDGSILSDRGVRMASFGGEVILNHDARRGYVATRGDGSITWFEISQDGTFIGCPLGNDGSLDACRIDIPGEPYRIAYTRLDRSQPLIDSEGRPILNPDGSPQTTALSFDLLAVAHLSEGLVSMVTVVDPPDSSAQPIFSSASAALLNLPSDIIHQPGTDRFVAAGRSDAGVIGVRPAISPTASVLGLFQDSTLVVPSPQGAFAGRSLLFNADSSRLYVTSQVPTALLTFDTSSSDDDLVSGTRNRLINMLDLPSDPNELAWVERPGNTPLLYITCLTDDSLIIVDPSLPAVLKRVPVGNGPFELVILPASANLPPRAVISHFTEHTVSVFDISDPLSPQETAIIAGADDLANAQANRNKPLR